MSRKRRLRMPDISNLPGPYPTADEIAARAHELFVTGGRQVKRVYEYWQAAEMELLEQAARRAVAAANESSR